MVSPHYSRRKVLVAATVAHLAHFDGITRYAQENDWHLVLDMMSTGNFPCGWMGDGILAVVDQQPGLISQIQGSGLASVLITSTDESTGLCSVDEDHEQVGRMAADHFLDRAYRRFAWAPLADNRANRERFRGFATRLAEYGCTCHVFPEAHRRDGQMSQYNWCDYRVRLAATLAELARPTAIFACNDSVAANLMDTCHDAGFAVPEEFAILGAGNDPLVCKSVPIPLSSIEPDHEQMGYRAAELLARIMNGDTAPARLLVPPKGVTPRVSTDVTAVSDPRIARALAFIAENFSNPMLSVVDVAAAAGVSRRHLERNFRHTTGYTVREHIGRTRMQEASRLLINHPRTRIADIAQLVGFAGEGSFFRTFRQFYGMSPQAHREQAAGNVITLRKPIDPDRGVIALERVTATA